MSLTQEYLDEHMLNNARLRQRKAQEQFKVHKDPSLLPVGKAIISSLKKHVTDSLIAKRDRAKSGKAGGHLAGMVFLRQTGLPMEVIAHGAVTGFVFKLMDRMLRREAKVRRATISQAIAEYVHSEWRVDAMNQTDPKLVKKLSRDFERRGYSKQMRIDSYKQYAHLLDDGWNAWSVSDKFQVGQLLLHIILEHTDVASTDPNNQYIHINDQIESVAAVIMEKSLSDYLLFYPC